MVRRLTPTEATNPHPFAQGRRFASCAQALSQRERDAVSGLTNWNVSARCRRKALMKVVFPAPLGPARRTRVGFTSLNVRSEVALPIVMDEMRRVVRYPNLRFPSDIIREAREDGIVWESGYEDLREPARLQQAL